MAEVNQSAHVTGDGNVTVQAQTVVIGSVPEALVVPRLAISFDTYWDARARGVESHVVPGSFFTNRVQALSELADWLVATPDPGDNLRIVGGGPGSGKSGLLAQVVARCDQTFRNRHPLSIADSSAMLAAAAIDGAAYARGLDYRQILSILAAAMDSDATDNDTMLTALAVYGRPATFVIDGIDESTDPLMVAENLCELAGTAADADLGLRLLVGARPGYARALYRSLGTAAAKRVMDLDTPPYFDKISLQEYVRRRLMSDGMPEPAPGQRVSPYRHRKQLAEQVARKVADRAGRSFLIAALTTAGLLKMNEVVDVTADGWDQFPDNVFDAMRKYLGRFPAQDRARVADLLRPLAYSHGAGLAPGPLWAALATAAARRYGSPYRADDVDWLLDNAADYLLEVNTQPGRDGTCKVYRLYHRALVDYVKHDDRDNENNPEERLYRALLDFVPCGPSGRPSWGLVDEPYILGHLVDHAAETGHLGELIQDAEFLPVADPVTVIARLRRHSEIDTSEARVYREAANFLADPSERLFQLQLYAARLEQRDLGRRLAVISANTRPRFEWTSEPDYAAEYEGHSGGVWMVKVTELAGRSVIVSGSSDMTVRLWDLATCVPVGVPIGGHTGEISALAVAELAGRPLVVTGSTDTTIRVWDLATGEPHGAPLAGHTGAVMSLTVADRAGRPVVVSASADATVRVWDLATGRPTGVVCTGHTGEVWSVDVTEMNGRPVVVSGSVDATVRVWDLGTGDLVAGPFTGHTGGIWALATAVLETGPVVITGGPDAALRVWDLATGKQFGDPLTGHGFGVWHLAVTDLGGKPVVVSGSMDMTLRIWDLTTRRPVGQPLTGHSSEVYTVTCAKLGDRPVVASSGADTTVRVWDLMTGALVAKSGTGRGLGMWRVATTRFGGKPAAVSGGTDSTVRLWDLATGIQIGAPFIGHQRGVWTIATAELGEGPVAVTAGGDTTIRLWDLAAGNEIDRTFAGHGGGVWTVEITILDGRPLVVSAGADATIRVWDLATGTPIGDPFTGHTAGIESIVMAELDGRPVVVSGSLDSSIRVWDLRTGGQVGAPFLGHAGGIWSVAVADLDGRPAVVSGGDSTVRVWDLATGAAANVVRLDVGVISIAISADNQLVIGHEAGLTAIQL